MMALWSWSVQAQPVELSLEAIDAANLPPDGDFAADVDFVYAVPEKAKVAGTLAVFRRDREAKSLLAVRTPLAFQGWSLLTTPDGPGSRRSILSDWAASDIRDEGQQAFFQQLVGPKQVASLWGGSPVAAGPHSPVVTLEGAGPVVLLLQALGKPSPLAPGFRIKGREAATLGALTTSCLTLEPQDPQGGIFLTKLWVTADGLIRKREDYRQDGKVFQVLRIGSYWSTQGRVVPQRLAWSDSLTGENWIFNWSNFRTSALADRVFTEAYQRLIVR